eukprot:345280-Pleurochrysis_carterae.AAC.1
MRSEPHRHTHHALWAAQFDLQMEKNDMMVRLTMSNDGLWGSVLAHELRLRASTDYHSNLSEHAHAARKPPRGARICEQ